MLTNTARCLFKFSYISFTKNKEESCPKKTDKKDKKNLLLTGTLPSQLDATDQKGCQTQPINIYIYIILCASHEWQTNFPSL